VDLLDDRIAIPDGQNKFVKFVIRPKFVLEEAAVSLGYCTSIGKKRLLQHLFHVNLKGIVYPRISILLSLYQTSNKNY